MPWEHHVVRGTLMRRSYVKEETKDSLRQDGLSERFYVASTFQHTFTSIGGRVCLNIEVQAPVLACIEEDAKRIFEDAKAKDGKFPKEGIPVDAQIIRHTKLSDRDQFRRDFKKSGMYVEFRDKRFLATSLNEDIISTPDAPTW